MEATTEERGLAAAPDPVDEPETQDEGGTEDTTSEESALREEQEAEERRQQEAAAAAKRLAKRPGGIAPTKARLQITGGAVDIAADDFPEKDDELEVTVRGWVKTDKSTTEMKGGSAVREAVFVVEEITAFTNNGRAQLTLDDD